MEGTDKEYALALNAANIIYSMSAKEVAKFVDKHDTSLDLLDAVADAAIQMAKFERLGDKDGDPVWDRTKGWIETCEWAAKQVLGGKVPTAEEIAEFALDCKLEAVAMFVKQ